MQLTPMRQKDILSFCSYMKKTNDISTRLLTWFRTAKRPMPWRKTPAPYICWLSEIMMQQTTYQTVLPYYTRFLTQFPTVKALAKASEQTVLKAWEGMGYYARARNLHKAAQQIATQGWPQSAAEWAALPGIGPYTAAALASVLHGEKVPVVDGNVARVFARYWRLDGDFSKQPVRARLAQRLQPCIDACSGTSLAEQPNDDTAVGMFNQAMMELGALVCTSKNPSCESCPLAKDCAARKAGEQERYPVKAAKSPLPVRHLTAVVIPDGRGRILLVQNSKGSLLKGLWELPSIEPATDLVHVFSHFRLELSVQRATRSGALFADPRKVPLTTATRKALVTCGLL